MGFLFVVISNFFNVLSPQVIRYSFDLVKENIGYYQLFSGFGLQAEFYKVFSAVLFFFGMTVLALALLKGIFMFFMRQTIIVMSRLIEYDMKNEMFNHYQRLSTAFYKRNNTGDLMSRISEDVSRVRMFVGPAIMYAVNLAALFIMVISAMLSVNPKLTLYVLIPLPILSISIYYVNNIINRKGELIQEKLSSITTEAQQVFSGIRVVKSYVKENMFNALFNKGAEAYKEESLGLVRVESFFNPLMMLLIGLSTIITIYIGGIQVMKGEITTGNIAEFVMYVNMLTWPVTALGWIVSIIQRAAASQKRINEFLHQPADIVSPTDDETPLKGHIEFRNVTFVYPDTGIKALENVSFEVKPGQKLAIIGRTGSGKTTIAELLLRMYDVTSGEILMDGKDIRTVSLHSLRKSIGYVPQDVFLFSDSIANNISFSGGMDATAPYETAAKNSSVHEDILQFKQGYETVVGERGVTLSGGQKQRISIARAIIKNPEIIILDDCLSAVDTRTEKMILQNLRSVLQNKTSVIVTHRVSALPDYDRILVLDNGKIAEAGTHRELLENKGLYYELFEKQRSEENILS